ncbi:ABC transporter substrate-binding protein [Actinocrinis puniceicyclus]|uniref:ABC transporter substrate-binding protein n=1 Tax=Actinocrinis puniceicyclus TaxID=977794 RepID=A0A8J7WGG3_9ACTN|nr:ABC transporter substrate-binding protein [Actinocrinis puniceicyclus]MBS2961816.1 ABC transporter substrate-binding protein [Actinocrinis puniceicyclus]
MRKTKLIAAVAGAIAVATAASACGSSSSGAVNSSTSSFNAGMTTVVNPSSHPGGVLRMAMASDWDSIDPGNTYYGFSWDFIRLYGRSLVTWKQAPGTAGLQLVPDLATDTGQVSPDGLTWTFHLRDGATYQDGSVVTAADVKYAVERSNWGQDTLVNGPGYFKNIVQDKTNYRGPYLDKNPADGVSGIEVDGTDTIKFHLTRKFSDFPELAALPSTIPVPRAKDTGANYYKSVVSSSQYEVSSYVPGKQAVLVPNPNFKSSSDPDGIHKVTADKITVQLDLNQDQLDQELLHGQLDVDLGGTGVGTTAQSQILANPALKSQADDGYTNALTFMTINTQVKPFDNIDCRRAVEFAVDKTTVQSALGGSIGGGDIASTLLTPNMSGYEQSNRYPTPGNQGDPQQAKAELATCQKAEPGQFTGGGMLNVKLSARLDRPKEVNSAVAIQAALALANINVEIEKYPSDKYFSAFAGNDAFVKSNKIGLSMMKWLADWPDVFGDLDQVITPDGIHPGGGSTNLGDYSSPKVQQLFGQYLGTNDAATRARVGAQIDQQAMDDAAIVPLTYNKALEYHPANVANWYMQPAFGMPDFSMLGVSGS